MIFKPHLSSLRLQGTVHPSYVQRGKQFASYLRSLDQRVFVLLLFFSFLFTIIIYRLFFLQVLDHKFYSALASDQYQMYKILVPQRGDIFFQDRTLPEEKRYLTENLHTVAMSRKYWQIYTKPYEVSDPKEAAQLLSEALFDEEQGKTRFLKQQGEVLSEAGNVDKKSLQDFLVQEKQSFTDTLYGRLSKVNDPYEPIARRVTDDTKEKIASLNLYGIYFIPEMFRFYPDMNVGSHVVGFVGEKEEERKGLYGIELSLEEELSGKVGYLQSERDVAGRLMSLAKSAFQPAQDGSNVVLTIDFTLEDFVCEKLAFSVKQYEAISGSIVIMDPQNGQIIAMCGYPDFNPNEYWKTENIAYFNNPAIFSPYEPGSVFKPVTMAAGIDLDFLQPNTVYDDPGRLVVSGHTISNYDGRSHGRKSMTEVLIESLNTGTMFVIDKIGKEKFINYVQNFGFGEETGIELPSEQKGNIDPLSQSGMIYAYTASFGQGITVTTLQLATAYSALVNGGVLLKPTIVDRIVEKNGVVKKSSIVPIRKVVSDRSSQLISGMLVSVVEKGHAKLAQVPGYYIGGKTGTAELAEGGAYTDKTIHTFVGFGTVDNPRFVMVVRLDEPKKGKYAESTAVPLFGEIAKFILNYYQIPPDREVNNQN
jgi:cell division protein FtsI/penicillin-binding protein 2